MKKLFALLLAMVMVFALTACDTGSNSDSPGSTTSITSQNASNDDDKQSTNNGGGTAIKDITNDNWQQVIKDNFLGVTINLPEGWTVSETVSMGGAHVYFDCKASTDEVSTFLENVFNELKKVAAGDITDADGVYNITYNSIEDIKNGKYITTAPFNVPVNADNSKRIYISYSFENGYDDATGESYIKQVKIYLSQNGDWD